MLLLVIGGMLTVHFFPRITKSVPSSLVAIIVSCFVEHVIFRMALPEEYWTPTVGDMSAEGVNGGLPVFHVPECNLDSEAIGILAPTAISLALVGLIESILTLQLVDEIVVIFIFSSFAFIFLRLSLSSRFQNDITGGLHRFSRAVHPRVPRARLRESGLGHVPVHGRRRDDRPVHHQRQVGGDWAAEHDLCRRHVSCLHPRLEHRYRARAYFCAHGKFRLFLNFYSEAQQTSRRSF